jgi:hypothetical protein
MNTELKDLITEIEPEFSNDGSFYNSLPNGISLYFENEKYVIDLQLKDEVLTSEIWINEDQQEIKLSEEDFYYNLLSKLLNEETEKVKEYYEAEKYEERY